ncbi:MAG: hypothetical protein KGQ88_11585, partial [Chloroflexi bacterium]|nr:hypothetical protein [Chloroflexota bacterium]
MAAVLGRVPAEDVASHPRLALAKGRQCLLTGDPAAALGSAASSAADLIHLGALLADRRGDHARALRDHRRAIALGDRGLTLLTRVVGLRNLASTLAQEDPRSAASLCGLALGLVEADGLDERLRPAIENVLAYALLCAGEIREGLRHAEATAADARRLGHRLTETRGRFNAAVAIELRGEIAEADRRLAELERTAVEPDLAELRGWIRLRRAWLAAKEGRWDDAVGALQRHFAASGPTVFHDSVATLRA